MKRSTRILMIISIVAVVGLFSIPSVTLDEERWLAPATDDANATIGTQSVVQHDVANWVTDQVATVSLPAAAADMQPFTATPVTFRNSSGIRRQALPALREQRPEQRPARNESAPSS